MSPPDEPSDNDFLFDLPLEPPTSGAADDAPETGAEGEEGDFLEVQRPLVFETSEPPAGAETAAAPFVTRGPDEPPVSSRLLAAILDLGTVAAGLAVALGAAGLLGVRLTLDLWPPLAQGRYDPEAQAVAMAVMIALEIAGFIWFLWPRRPSR